MTYYEGVDYFVRKVEFPNMASPGMAASNCDGTFNIYINSLFCEEIQTNTLRHELEHLIQNHFYRDEPVALMEYEANRQELSAEIFPELCAANI